MRGLFAVHLLLLMLLMTACQPAATADTLTPSATPVSTPTSVVSATPVPVYVFNLTPVDPAKANLSLLDKIRGTLQSRLEAELSGTVTANVASNQLVVEVTDDTDAESARQILSQSHTTIFFAADSPYAVENRVPPGEMVLMSGEDIIAAQAETLPSGEWAVNVQLTSVGGRILDTFAAVNQGRYMMIAQDGQVIGAFVIRWHDAKTSAGLYVSDTQLRIRGEFTESAAKTLATQLNGSQLPLELSLAEIER